MARSTGQRAPAGSERPGAKSWFSLDLASLASGLLFGMVSLMLAGVQLRGARITDANMGTVRRYVRHMHDDMHAVARDVRDGVRADFFPLLIAIIRHL